MYNRLLDSLIAVADCSSVTMNSMMIAMCSKRILASGRLKSKSH